MHKDVYNECMHVHVHVHLARAARSKRTKRLALRTSRGEHCLEEGDAREEVETDDHKSHSRDRLRRVWVDGVRGVDVDTAEWTTTAGGLQLWRVQCFIPVFASGLHFYIDICVYFYMYVLG